MVSLGSPGNNRNNVRAKIFSLETSFLLDISRGTIFFEKALSRNTCNKKGSCRFPWQ
jgi:hypothetical protein